jgi:hypothetical protein
MEDVNHDIAVIEDDPLAHRKSVHGMGPDRVILFEPVLDFTRNRFQMRLGGPGADQEKIGKTGDAAQVERDDALGFFAGGELSGEPGEIYGFDGGGFR